MPYESLRRRLDGGLDGRDVVALPDGSVDRYVAVVDAAGERVETKAAFTERLSGPIRSMRLRPLSARAGGQSVNAAKQVDALDGTITLVGHLDAPELRHLPFQTVSMGDPATVQVLSFDESELMLSVESGDIREWELADLFDALGVDPDEWVTDEIVTVHNWAGFDGMTDALLALADQDLGSTTVVFDPGDVSGAPLEGLAELGDALGTLAGATTVVVSADDAELARLAAAVDVSAEGTDREAALRTALGVETVVRHAESQAVAAGESVTVVENFDAHRVASRAGAGDRFTGGLATALAADLDIDLALALGNACATHFVERGETATQADIRRLVADRAPP